MIGSLRYELGTLLAMGPGYVPLVGACVLLALGVAVIVKAFVAPDTVTRAVTPEEGEQADEIEHEVPTTVSLRTLDARAIVMLTAAPIFFALTVSGLGLLPATFGAGLVAALARKETSVLTALLVSLGLTLASYVIFVVLLQVRIGLFGDWLGG